MDSEARAKLEIPEQELLKLFIIDWLKAKNPDFFLEEQLEYLKIMKEESSYEKGDEIIPPKIKYVFEYASLLKSESIREQHPGHYLKEENLDELADQILLNLLIISWAQLRYGAKGFVDEYVEKFMPLFIRMFNNKEGESINIGVLVQMELTELDKILNPNIPYSKEGYNSSTIEEVLETVGAKTTIDKIKKTYEILLEGIQYLPKIKSLTEFTIDSYLTVRVLLGYKEFLETKIKTNQNIVKEFRLTIKKEIGIGSPIDKNSFSMKEGTENVWKQINEYINKNEWAEGDIFFDEEPVKWLEDDGLYTLVEFVERITKYHIEDFYKNDLYSSDIKKDDRNAFIIAFFTVGKNSAKQKQITRDDLKDPRKKKTKERNRKVRREFIEYLEKLIAILNDKPYNRGYATIED